MNGAQTLVETLILYDTSVVFGLPGDTTVDLSDALRAELGRIRHLMAHDGRSAALMADVYARLTGRRGIYEGPSGGGATYLLPGVVEARGSSVAMIALTTDNPVDYEAQGALTDLDQPQIYRSVTKWTAVVKRGDMLPRFLRRAFRLATSGRPGAVHLGLPKDVLAEELMAPVPIYTEGACRTWPSFRTRPAADAVSRVARKLLAAERPVIMAGRGAVSSGAFDELRAVCEFLNGSVVTTIYGKRAVAETHPLSLGVIGANGSRPYAGQVVGQADLVLFLVCKANYVDTDSWRLPSLADPPAIVQIDFDPSELGNNYPVDEGLCGDAQLTLADLHQALGERDRRRLRSRRQPGAPKTVSLPAARNDRFCRSGSSTSCTACCRKRRWSCAIPAHRLSVRGGRVRAAPVGSLGLISPRAQGALGYAMPGVVGARLARPDRPVVGLCGDGSFAMSAGHLATVSRVGGPVVLVLFNNGCYAWIKAHQDLYHGGRFFSVDFQEKLSYLQVARGFGLPEVQVRDAEDLGKALRDSLDQGEPTVIEVLAAPEHQVLPPVAPWQRAAAAASTTGPE